MSEDVSFIVLIPARLASTRLPNKALADIAGKPMVIRVAEQAQKSRAKQVIVATDSQEVIDACQNHGVQFVMTSAKHTSGTERLAEAAKALNLLSDDIIVNVQGDEPLIEPELINQVAEHLASRPVPMATAAHPILSQEEFENPNCVKVVLNHAGEAIYFSRSPIPYPRDQRSELPKNMPVLRHIGIYGYRAGFLSAYSHMDISPLEQVESLEQLRVLWHDYKIGVELTEKAPEAGVDTEADLLRVRAFFEKNNVY